MRIVLSKLIKNRLSAKQRQALSQKFKSRFEKTEACFMEERFSEFEYVYCDVRANSMSIMFEEEW